jgi:putative hemolysin
LSFVLGVALVGLLLYISTLSCTLPILSRSRLSESLHNGQRVRWIPWLDRHEAVLQTTLALVKLIVTCAVFAGVHVWGSAALWANLPGLAPILISALAALCVLGVFGVAVPQALANHAGEAIFARSLGFVAGLRVLAWPVTSVLMGVERVVQRMLGSSGPDDAAASERAEQEILDAVSEGEAQGAVDEEQKEMIESIIQLRETPVSAIMTPRTDMNALPVDAGYEDFRRLILVKGHSRIPVFDGTIDHVVGVVYAKDLLRLDARQPFDARTIMRSVPFVPETKTLDELLDEFRSKKVQIALVLDEYGGTAGLCTIEDILEELVGEIDDEYDQAPPTAISRIDENTLEVDARVHVREVNAELDLGLPEEADYETIGGFVFATLGKIPVAGEQFTHEQVHFQVIAAEPRKINRLRIQVQRQPQSA